MILLKITNASDVVASKAGKLFEKMTPEMIDQKLVESQVIQQMIDQLQLTDNWKSRFQKNCETFFLYPAIRIYHKSIH